MRTCQRIAVGIATLLLILPARAEFQWQQAEDVTALGWSEEKLDAAQRLAEELRTESVIIVDASGVVIRQWGPVDRAFDIFSARKSLISLLYGVYGDRIDLQASLADLGIDDRQGLSDQEKTARVEHLLQSRSGVYHPAAWETRGMIANRPERDSHPPGSHWYYNNWDFNALNTIFQRTTGMSVTQGLIQGLAEPLGFEDFSDRNSFLLYEELSEHPSALLWMSARDLARIGLLLIQDGVWQGQRILSEDWIRRTTAVSSEIGILGGYGHSWWSARAGQHFPFVQLPDGTFSARGTGEQILLVIPAHQTIIVHRGTVCGPGSDLMHVTDFGRLLAKILEAKGIHSSPFPP